MKIGIKKNLGFSIIKVMALVAAVSAAGIYMVNENKKEEKAAKAQAERDGIQRLELIMRRLADADSLAGSTSRIALAGPVKTLQDLAAETESTPVTKCLEPARSSLASGIRNTAGRYLAFMRKEDHNSYMKGIMEDLMLARKKIRDCIPV